MIDYDSWSFACFQVIFFPSSYSQALVCLASKFRGDQVLSAQYSESA